mmetsp:Transcript_11950/g.49893  ORF Transcript_11950/g.49893 Transcript_11950/m.49893 type:complete len:537 (-) Transcript_11950:234-1844(-)|eukprot:CAMPEP_0113968780 /NCGR_PEP_ID=MMETSP0011_2-20120614/9769_1 /TAXON_ID=101924 /ORGANISM="Rhodosorus marinus" /LENGTH=536 /DNA_ID=CAMNT_0000981999 /DNA_START=67 /DNA_END=1677 /DNA_ORIENTATION=+ /assembly_acc=CAM_ASM_000156
MTEAGTFDDLFAGADSPKPPFLESRSYMIHGEMLKWPGETETVYSPVMKKLADGGEAIPIGTFALVDEKVSLEAAECCRKAFNQGRGEWPAMKAEGRIKAVENFVRKIKEKRDEIVELIMWEICKSKPDAEKEFDRTMQYVLDTIVDYKNEQNKESSVVAAPGYMAKIRRVPLGVVMCSSPTNYPYNELYTTLIPALLTGNCAVVKVPRTGGLCHLPTFELFAECFPAGTVAMLTGKGRTVMQTIMKSGMVDAFAFIGSTKAAIDLTKVHPRPNRLKLCLGLEAKNPGIVFPDADIDLAVAECTTGSTSYNGMRCTAIKIIYLHSSIKDEFMEKFCKKVDSLKMGLPWESGVKITPLAENDKAKYLNGLVTDAVEKGAKIANERGGKYDRTLYAPTILFPVKDGMKVYEEEQFGPVIPVTTFDDVEEVWADLLKSNYGQQAAVFSRSPDTIAKSIDVLTHAVARVNINGQCQRGPDVFPFTARKDSAAATLSVHDALRTFTIRAMVAIKQDDAGTKLLRDVVKDDTSKFMAYDYLP